MKRKIPLKALVETTYITLYDTNAINVLLISYQNKNHSFRDVANNLERMLIVNHSSNHRYF